MPKALYEEKTRGNGNTPEDFAIEAAKMKEIFEVVKIRAERANADQMCHYNLRRRKWRPALGFLVLVKQHQLSRGVDGFAAKLAPKYDGPFREGARTLRNARKRTRKKNHFGFARQSHRDSLDLYAKEGRITHPRTGIQIRRRFAETVKAGELSPSQRVRLDRLEAGSVNVGANGDVKRVEEADLDPGSIQLQVPGFFDRERAIATEGATGRNNTKCNLTPENEMAWGGNFGRITAHGVIAEQVRKWGLKFNGHTDPLGFLEELEERATSYALPLAQLPRVMTETLTDRAGNHLASIPAGVLRLLLTPTLFSTIGRRHQSSLPT